MLYSTGYRPHICTPTAPTTDSHIPHINMSSTNSANPPNFPEDVHFDGTNYLTFKNRVLIAARVCGACGYLDGSITKPEPNIKIADPETKPTEWSSKNPSLEEWEERDAWTLGLIVYNTKNPVGMGIRMDGTAADAWTALTDNYGVFLEIVVMNAKKRLQATEFQHLQITMVCSWRLW